MVLHFGKTNGQMLMWEQTFMKTHIILLLSPENLKKKKKDLRISLYVNFSKMRKIMFLNHDRTEILKLI